MSIADDTSARPSSVPVSLQDVAETLGLRVVVKLIQHFGGTEIKFPKNPHEGHPILLALGKEDGTAVCNFMSGSFVYVPHNRRGAVAADIKRLEAQGKGRREIARLLGVSQRHVRRVANHENPDQLTLL